MSRAEPWSPPDPSNPVTVLFKYPLGWGAALGADGWHHEAAELREIVGTAIRKKLKNQLLRARNAGGGHVGLLLDAHQRATGKTRRGPSSLRRRQRSRGAGRRVPRGARHGVASPGRRCTHHRVSARGSDRYLMTSSPPPKELRSACRVGPARPAGS